MTYHPVDARTNSSPSCSSARAGKGWLDEQGKTEDATKRRVLPVIEHRRGEGG